MQVVINHCHGGFGFSAKAEEILTALLGEDGCYNLELYENRHNPILVALVKQMGKAVNGNFANLEVCDIPDGLDYDIEEYDGYESVIPYLGVTEEELRNGLSEERFSLLKYTNIIRVKY